MGYAHGTKWNDEKIIEEIKKVSNVLNLDRMPSKSEIESVSKNSSLTNAIAKRNGFAYWAEKCGLDIKDSETKTGKKYEFITELIISEKCCLCTEQMSTKHPFDLLVGEFVKVDVKAGKKYKYGSTGYYSFNLEKNPATCDIYICHCLSDDDEIIKTFVIPATKLKKTQLSVGEKSMYDKFIDAWHYVNLYDEFYKSIE